MGKPRISTSTVYGVSQTHAPDLAPIHRVHTSNTVALYPRLLIPAGTPTRQEREPPACDNRPRDKTLRCAPTISNHQRTI